MKRREIVFHRSDEYEEIECCDHCHGEPHQCPDMKALTPDERERWARNNYPDEALALVRDYCEGRVDLRDLRRFVIRVDSRATVTV